MRFSLEWAILVLSVPLSIAEVIRSPSWTDLMIATHQYPRFFGSAAEVRGNGPAETVGLSGENGEVVPMKCRLIAEEDDMLDCAADGFIFNDRTAWVIREIILLSWPELTNRSFIFDRELYREDNGTTFASEIFLQTHRKMTVLIDNAFLRINVQQGPSGDITAQHPEEDSIFGQLYLGDIDPGPPEESRSCTALLARDTSALALDQPLWDALYPADYKLLYTVQDGRLFLAWRVTFGIKEKVGDNFIVWINARDCTEVIAAAPAEMNNYVRTLEEFDLEQRRLFEERGIGVVDPGDGSRTLRIVKMARGREASQ